MTKRFATTVVVFLACTLLVGSAPGASGRLEAKPDIILIMSDDMGFSDIGCYGGEINTPHLDRSPRLA